MSNAEAQSRGALPSPLPSTPSIWQQSHLLIIAVGVVLMCGTAIVVTFSVLRQSQNAQRDVESLRAQLNGKDGTSASPASADGENTGQEQGSYSATSRQGGEFRDTEVSIARRARLLTVQGRLQDAEESLKKTKEILQRWDGEFRELLNNETGRRIASDRDAARKFLDVMGMDRPSREAIDRLQERLDNLLNPVLASARDREFDILTPNDDFSAEADHVVTDFRAVFDSLARQTILVEDLILKHAAVPPATITLGEVVQEIRKENSERLLAEIEAERKAAQVAADALIVAAEKEAVAARGRAEAEARRILGETEAAAIIEEAKLRKEKLDDDLARRKEEQRVAELRKRAADPIVQQRYTPFLDKGKLLFDQGDDYNSGYSERTLPVSWQNLNNGKWLDSSERFAKALSNPYVNAKNDRRVKSYPRNETEWKEMDRLYEEFKQLGPIWVEMGLLLP